MVNQQMKDKNKTKDQPINEVGKLRQIVELTKLKTDRKKSEEMLLKQSLILDQSHDSIIATDLDGYVTSWNKGAERMFSYSAEEALGRHISFIYPEDQHELLKHEIIAPLKKKGEHKAEVRLRRKSGEEFHAVLLLTLLRDENDKVIGMVGSSMDITERKRAEEVLRESEERFRLIAETITEAFWIADIPIERMFYVSSGYERIWRRTCKSLYENPRSFLDAVHPEDRERIFANLALEKTGQPFDHEYRIVWPDGSIRWIWDRGFPVRDKNGQVTRYVGVARDITERKLVEQQLKRTSDALARSNAELRQFAFGVAHDLLNPLNIIAGCIYLFKQRYKGKMGVQFDNLLEYSINEFNKIKGFVQDLLAYAKIETTSQDFDSVDFSSVVDEAVNNLQQDIKESGAAVTYDNLPVVIADKIQMIRLFQNLISNAIKYCGKKSPKINISAEWKENEWFFSVQDNGIGIEAKNFERIFTMFQRVDDTSGHPGAGIGLAICKKIVECHGGRIWVESEPEKGSTFYFTMPSEGNKT